MSFHQDGFLAIQPGCADLEIIDPSLVTFRDLAQEVNRFAMSVLIEKRPRPEPATEAYTIALAGRMVQDYQSSILLADMGLRAQSRSMARAVLEAALFCSAACTNQLLHKAVRNKPTTFWDALLAGHLRYRRNVAKELAVQDGVDEQRKERMRRLNEELEREPSPNPIDTKGLAEDLGLLGMYTVLFRALSQDSHPSLTALDQHFELTGDGDIAGFRIGPDFTYYADTVLASIASLCIGLEPFLHKYGGPTEQQQLALLVSKYKSLDSMPR